MLKSKRSRAKPGLTRKLILQTALDLLDREGLEALSMRRLGAALRVEAMSLYNHVANKEAVLDGIVEIVLDEIVLPPPTGNWETDLRALAHAYRAVLRRHPAALPIVSTRPVATVWALNKLEYALTLFHRAGLEGLEATYALNIGAAFVIGHVLLEVGVTPGTEQTPLEPAGAPLRGLSVPPTYPNILAVLPKMKRRDPDQEFAYGLDALIAGFRTKLP
jgi:TetR/AcrR family transcriptional regulator, tetracycline repressor protein